MRKVVRLQILDFNYKAHFTRKKKLIYWNLLKLNFLLCKKLRKRQEII